MEEFLVTEKTVEAIFIDIGEIGRVYNSDRELTVSLWRALRTDVKSGGPLYPDFYRREIRAGKFRQPDVTVREVGEVECVVPKVYKKRPEDVWKAQGTSLFDKPDTFAGESWWYFEIPAGTKIPEGIIIIKDDYNERFRATHYSIVPNRAMPLAEFKSLLDQLARNAIGMKERRA